MPEFGPSGKSASSSDMSPEASGLLKNASELLAAHKRAVEAQAAGSVAGAVVRSVLNGENGHTAAAPGTEQVRALADATRTVSEVYSGITEKAMRENEQLRQQQGVAYEQGREAEREVAEAKIDALVRIQQMNMKWIDTLREIEERRENAHKEELNALREQLNKEREARIQAEISALRAEISSLKNNSQQNNNGQNGAVPIVGFRPVQLPDGRTVYVQENSQNNITSVIESTKQHLSAVADLVEYVDKIRRPQSSGPDPNDPQTRWQHATIDWWRELKDTEIEGNRRLTEARVKREEAVAEAVRKLPEVIGRHVPRVSATLFGGAPARGMHNGLPETPPPRFRQPAQGQVQDIAQAPVVAPEQPSSRPSSVPPVDAGHPEVVEL